MLTLAEAKALQIAGFSPVLLAPAEARAEAAALAKELLPVAEAAARAWATAAGQEAGGRRGVQWHKNSHWQPGWLLHAALELCVPAGQPQGVRSSSPAEVLPWPRAVAAACRQGQERGRSTAVGPGRHGPTLGSEHLPRTLRLRGPPGAAPCSLPAAYTLQRRALLPLWKLTLAKALATADWPWANAAAAAWAAAAPWPDAKACRQLQMRCAFISQSAE